ncbi:transcriptional regulator PtsJ [Brachybacterium endophyticum]|uniref:Transcriptional regulator PtsJ n=1 Tax=Brachybacterium endophyticum TaxID=2182385 RepID=A0A2U2RPS5_9MICO|nr:aminotransferase class I/II-fold pyridoxal phosphate-dependent enzyme [Brachybacterium endophyticum]PWH07869.1 transcriptional regulator PtsJ [Brachybacterium endophyticum]
MIRGATAADIADSIRGLVERGHLVPGDPLPPVRSLAARQGINRNTAVAAYRRLARAGIVQAQGRAGTRIAPRSHLPQEGYAPSGALKDLGSGNPAPRFIPDPSLALGEAVGRPVLYGEPVVDANLEQWAREWMRPDTPAPPRISVTSGAVDAIERLLAQVLERGDTVGLEDPCFLASIQTVRLAGYRPSPIAVDEEGMTVAGLREALEGGARAIVCTPRAQNPTGASLSEERATQLRAVLADHPYVLVIEDDYYSLLARSPFRSIVGSAHKRWALVRSVSKFLGPDLCLALVGSDAETAERLALRLSPGTTWVSHLLQRIAYGLLSDGSSRDLIARAGLHYAERDAAAAQQLRERGVAAEQRDGMSLWVPCGAPARTVAEHLMRRGWLARTGEDFRIRAGGEPSEHLRLTVHDLEARELGELAHDLREAIDDAVREAD